MKKIRTSSSKKTLISSKLIIYLLIIVAILGAISFWYFQRNTYSKDILKLEILGPSEVSVGEEIEYLVKFKNNGDVRLETPKLTFEYPKYSEPSEGKSIRTEILADEIGSIYPGEEKTYSFKARIFGKEGETKNAKVNLSYRPKNLNATYESETRLTSVISQVPLTFEFDLSSKVESGEDFSFRINYFSNINYPVEDLRIKVNYPQSFEFISAVPRTLEKTEWEIGMLNKAEGGRIEVEGALMGGVGQNNIFSAELGIWKEGEFVILKEDMKGIEIVEPSLYILQQVNGNPSYTASPGDTLHYEIFFRNIGRKALEKLFLIVKLNGDAYDFSTIRTNQGSFEIGDNSIIFDWRRVSELQFLGTRNEGSVEFWIDLKDSWKMEGDQDKNPTISNMIYLSQAQKAYEYKVSSKVELNQMGFFNDINFGEEDKIIFSNSGQNPPKKGVPTTYTVVWKVNNYFNDLEGVKVKALLPENVKLTGDMYPEDLKLTFDSKSREIVWNVGDITAGKGVFEGSESNMAVFQVLLDPVKDGEAILVKESIIEGEDIFTESVINVSFPLLKILSDGTIKNDITEE